MGKNGLKKLLLLSKEGGAAAQLNTAQFRTDRYMEGRNIITRK
jgi:hypothetical protein